MSYGGGAPFDGLRVPIDKLRVPIDKLRVPLTQGLDEMEDLRWQSRD